MTDEPRTYRTKTGRVLPEADIKALAEEAERGYDVEHLRQRGARLQRDCVDGKEHGEIITVDDERYDPQVLAPLGAPPIIKVAPWQGGYCGDCGQGFRWSVNDHQWRSWPGGLAQLPHLDDEELEHLHAAIVTRREGLDATASRVGTDEARVQIGRVVQILRSLDTAVQEARYGLYPREGAHEPRAWGEAWDVLVKWIDEQMSGIGRSSQNDATNAASNAFLQVLVKVTELRGG